MTHACGLFHFPRSHAQNSEKTHSAYKLCQEPCKSYVRGYSQKCLAGNVHLQLIEEGTRICCY